MRSATVARGWGERVRRPTPVLPMLLMMATLAGAVVFSRQPPAPRPSMQISVTGGARGNEADPYAARYEEQATGQRVSIRPSMRYLSLLAEGGPIEPISFVYEPFKWGFPNLVALVVNRSNAPLRLTSAEFTVRRSQLDPTPIPVVVPDDNRSNALHVRLVNEGWGPLGDLQVVFNLLPLQVNLLPEHYKLPFAHTISVGSVDQFKNVDVSAAIVKEGVKLPKPSADDGRLRNRGGRPDDPAFGRFKGGGAHLVGQLRYNAGAADGKVTPRSVRFATEVWFYNEFAVGVPAPPSYNYEAKFEVTGANYLVKVPIAKTIAAGAQESIAIRIGVAKSSIHDFTLAFRGNSANMQSPPIHMEVFIPRSGADYIQGR